MIINPYFELEEETILSNMDDILTRNIKAVFYQPGSQKIVNDSASYFQFPYQTTGLFRGQIRDWPLIPKCYRQVDLLEDFSQWSFIRKDIAFTQAVQSFNSFCVRAEKQVPSFPKDEINRMSIAQHYGIDTPLLDWSQNIFTAIFFAIKEIFSYPEFLDNFSIYIYHIIDERYLDHNITSELSEQKQSAFIRPIHIDRRLERQNGIFTFHPHPSLIPKKIPYKLYILKEATILNVRRIMDGLGFTEDYFFPDYAGIANAVKNNSSL